MLTSRTVTHCPCLIFAPRSSAREVGLQAESQASGAERPDAASAWESACLWRHPAIPYMLTHVAAERLPRGGAADPCSYPTGGGGSGGWATVAFLLLCWEPFGGVV